MGKSLPTDKGHHCAFSQKVRIVISLRKRLGYILEAPCANIYEGSIPPKCAIWGSIESGCFWALFRSVWLGGDKFFQGLVMARCSNFRRFYILQSNWTLL